jgi:hypothetical protein
VVLALGATACGGDTGGTGGTGAEGTPTPEVSSPATQNPQAVRTTLYLAHLLFGLILGALVHRFGTHVTPLWNLLAISCAE